VFAVVHGCAGSGMFVSCNVREVAVPEASGATLEQCGDTNGIYVTLISGDPDVAS
jgi:hypothetical protein